jgi:hypothetical protein
MEAETGLRRQQVGIDVMALAREVESTRCDGDAHGRYEGTWTSPCTPGQADGREKSSRACVRLALAGLDRSLYLLCS